MIDALTVFVTGFVGGIITGRPFGFGAFSHC
jgi:hypothetical protein